MICSGTCIYIYIYIYVCVCVCVCVCACVCVYLFVCVGHQSREIFIDSKESKGVKMISYSPDDASEWPVRNETSTPVWNACKPLIPFKTRKMPQSDRLHIALYDFSERGGEVNIHYQSTHIFTINQHTYSLSINTHILYHHVVIAINTTTVNT